MTTTSTWRPSPALYVMLAHHLQAPASAQPPAQAQHWVFYNYKHHDGQGDSALLYHTLDMLFLKEVRLTNDSKVAY